jgi:tetratricopeptide (TPR) repeat protein
MYADILFRLGENTEAENHYKKALEICINKKGKEHQQTAVFYCEYGIFLTSLKKYDKAKNFLTKAYRIFKNKNGEENLYAVRCLCHLYYLDYCKMDYNSAFAKVNKAFLILTKIKGDNDIETELNKNICGKMLVMLKQYNEAVDYLSSPFVIVSGKEELFLLLDYNKDFMPAPQIIICKKGIFVKKLIKIAKSKNIPIIKNHVLAKGLMKDCGQFVTVLPVYYKPLAKILTKIIKVKK